MNREIIETRWKNIQHNGISQYSSLLISASCKPELFLACDKIGDRFLILHVPPETKISCYPVILRNLSIEWHRERRFIVIGLRNIRFSDLFTDLTLSLYNRISESEDPRLYTSEFINSFHRWADFFDDAFSGISENTLKGLFGELTVLEWLIRNSDQLPLNAILSTWQGPYNRAQDFIFPQYNLEVKTKEHTETNISISGEFQLTPENDKGLQLGVVDVRSSEDGISVSKLMNDLNILIRTLNGDTDIFSEALSRIGLNFTNAANYDRFRWKTISIIYYDCCLPGFPKITSTSLPNAISRVRYSLYVPLLDTFIIQRIIF